MRLLLIVAIVLLTSCSFNRKQRVNPIPPEDMYNYSGARREIICRVVVVGLYREDEFIYRPDCV
jgi:hypothetical protein